MASQYVVPSYKYTSKTEPGAVHTIVCTSPWSHNAPNAGETTSIDHDVGAGVGAVGSNDNVGCDDGCDDGCGDGCGDW